MAFITSQTLPIKPLSNPGQTVPSTLEPKPSCTIKHLGCIPTPPVEASIARADHQEDFYRSLEERVHHEKGLGSLHGTVPFCRTPCVRASIVFSTSPSHLVSKMEPTNTIEARAPNYLIGGLAYRPSPNRPGARPWRCSAASLALSPPCTAVASVGRRSPAASPLAAAELPRPRPDVFSSFFYFSCIQQLFLFILSQ